MEKSIRRVKSNSASLVTSLGFIGALTGKLFAASFGLLVSLIWICVKAAGKSAPVRWVRNTISGYIDQVEEHMNDGRLYARDVIPCIVCGTILYWVLYWIGFPV